MTSRAFQTFEHAIQDADDLQKHFDALNKQPPPPEIEVLKRASLVMALAALETYVEDRIVEAADAVSGLGSEENHLVKFYKSSLENDLKFFHTPSTDKVKAIFFKYLNIDVTEGWTWNHYDPTRVRSELNKIAKKRGYCSPILEACRGPTYSTRGYARRSTKEYSFHQESREGN